MNTICDTSKDYKIYQTTGQPAKKLKAALTVYLSGARDQAWQDCRGYIRDRRRPAWELLIREENLDGLEQIWKEGWISGEVLIQSIRLAVDCGKRESQLWLLSKKKQRGSGNTGPDDQHYGFPFTSDALSAMAPSQSDVGGEIRKILELQLSRKIPSLPSAFPYLRWRPVKEGGRETKAYAMAADGQQLFYCLPLLEQLFLTDMAALERTYLHSLFHCLYLHMLPPADVMRSEGKQRMAWNLAADIAVEWALDESGWLEVDALYEKRRVCYEKIAEQYERRDTGTCYRWVMYQMKQIEQPAQIGWAEFSEAAESVKWKEMTALFARDDHRFWYCGGQEEKRTTDEGTLLDTWSRARTALSLGETLGNSQAGRQSGGIREPYQTRKKSVYDYRKFLRRFTICREEMQLDMESFDPISYYYGRKRYGNVLLMEPLETTEMNRLEEFVIAIDTSGSCSAAMVSRFLDETYAILSNRENFFRKMNVHMIQCDSVVQDHQKITSEQEWKDYLEHVTIQGRGGTDFTPVFRLVDELLVKKEIRHLKGLLYFTDGDGIYPRSKPAYDTAFVFLNRKLEKQKVPNWALRLNLDLKEI